MKLYLVIKNVKKKDGSKFGKHLAFTVNPDGSMGSNCFEVTYYNEVKEIFTTKDYPLLIDTNNCKYWTKQRKYVSVDSVTGQIKNKVKNIIVFEEINQAEKGVKIKSLTIEDILEKSEENEGK